ncbi:hypothetical protein [Sphingobacterium phlebotomi]|nr:hypothetical protein [Sphingobacterium phlebotomi]
MGERVKWIYATPVQVVANIIINATRATIVIVVYGVLLMTSSF